MLCSVLSIGPPIVSPASRNICRQTGQSYPSFSINFIEVNPRSNMTITGPSQPNNIRVSINSDGVVDITMVQEDDAGIYVATWNNGIGDAATFTLNLTVESKLVHAFTWYLEHFLAKPICAYYCTYFTKLYKKLLKFSVIFSLVTWKRLVLLCWTWPLCAPRSLLSAAIWTVENGIWPKTWSMTSSSPYSENCVTNTSRAIKHNNSIYLT